MARYIFGGGDGQYNRLWSEMIEEAKKFACGQQITCPKCNGTKVITQAVNCSHGKSSSHWRCGHGENQSANYHT